MPVRIFQLRGVPEDEVAEVRAVLESHQVRFYETPAGNWGVSSPAFWSEDEVDAERARHLIDDYQQQRAERERERYRQLRASGQQPTVWRRLRDEPLKVIVLTAIAAAVAYFSIAPFLDVG